MIQRPKGTQDFIDYTLYNFIVETTKKYLYLHNFSEIATPILEHLELFKRSLGQFTDVVGKEMFIIQPHEAKDATKEEDLLCLRPEMTASTVRAFLENNIE